MLYEDTFINLEKEVESIVQHLFELAYKNQTHDGDMFLVLEHGFYHEDFERMGTPYSIGPNDIGFAEFTMNKFFDSHLGTTKKIGERIPSINDILAKKDYLHITEEYSVNIEMLMYLKFWESDIILKRLYQLTILAQRKDYNWYKKFHRKGKLMSHILESLQIINPDIFNFFNKVYKSQIRNAIAHSDFSIMFSRQISLINFDKKKKNLIYSISFEEWENYIHYTVLIWLHIHKQMDLYQKKYIAHSDEHHYGVEVRHIKPDREHFMRFKNYEHNVPRWTDYEVLPKR